MRKKLKSAVSLCLAMSMFGLMAMNCYAGGPEEAQINLGTKYTEACELTSEEKEKSEAKITEARKLRASSGGIELEGHEQIVGYYCGPAAALTTINHLGGIVPSTTATLNFFNANESDSNCKHPAVNHVHSKQYKSPQITLANALGTTYDGTSISNIHTVVNNRQIKYDLSAEHIDDTVNSSNINQLGECLLTAFRYDSPAILWVQAGLLNQYVNNNSRNFGGHFICAASYNSNSEVVGIFDPNYYSLIDDYYTEDADSVVNAIWVNSASNINILF